MAAFRFVAQERGTTSRIKNHDIDSAIVVQVVKSGTASTAFEEGAIAGFVGYINEFSAATIS